MFFRTVFLIASVSLCFLKPGVAQTDTSEWIKVYFNMPGNTELADSGNINNSSWDLIGTLEQLIDSATTSIDVCIYDIENQRIAQALVRAKARGVIVRLVTDNYNRTDGNYLDTQMWDTLRLGRIYSIDDDGDVYKPGGEIIDNKLTNAGADMHNKFAVIDYSSPSPDDDYVWTGSTNLTYTGAYNTNNVVILKDTDVAKVYTEEFIQMWGSTDSIPDPQKSRFHKDKSDASTHIFDVGGTRVEIYFAPINREGSKPSISKRLVELINNEAQSDIKFQAFAISPSIPLSQALWRVSLTNHIKLSGVIDKGFYSRYEKAGNIWGSPEARAGNREILGSNEMRKLHHKILIIDSDNKNPDDIAVVVTGSYNFSNNAETNNDENLLIIYSDKIANQYAQDFGGVLSRARGQTEPPAPPVDPEMWYPVFSIRDAGSFDIEVLPGFGYEVRLLGVMAPYIYAGTDSSHYFAGPAAEYAKNILEGRKVRVRGTDGGKPESRYNAFRAYVDVDVDGEIKSLNKMMLAGGYATYSEYYRQDLDSIFAFKNYETQAKQEGAGIWKYPSKIGSKVSRVAELKKSDALDVVYPININTADPATLQLLPGIGRAYAQRIIEYREKNDGFKNVQELTNIKGIGPKTFAKLRPVVTVE